MDIYEENEDLGDRPDWNDPRFEEETTSFFQVEF